MTSQSSGGSGSGLPGVTGDGLTPGGLHVAGEETVAGAITGGSLTAGTVTSTGAINAGNPNAADFPDFNHINGYLRVRDAPGNDVDGDSVFDVLQNQPLSVGGAQQAMKVLRGGTLNGFDYGDAALSVTDVTASAQPAFYVNKNSATQFQVDGDGIRVHGKFKTGASVTHTLGSYSGKSVPIYDEAGTLLGYMPLYA